MGSEMCIRDRLLSDSGDPEVDSWKDPDLQMVRAGYALDASSSAYPYECMAYEGQPCTEMTVRDTVRRQEGLLKNPDFEPHC